MKSRVQYATWIGGLLLLTISALVIRHNWRPVSSPPNDSAAQAVASPLTQQGPAVVQMAAVTSNQRPVRIPAISAIQEFNRWTAGYLQAPAGQRKELEEAGVELARERRIALKQMIQSDPEQALREAVPFSLRRQLPAAVAGLLEEKVSGRGELAVLGALPEEGKPITAPPIFRVAKVGGRQYQAFVYGRRAGEPTRPNTSLHGIAIDDMAAVHEDRVRIMEREEVPNLEQLASEAICGVSEQPAAANHTPTPIEVQGRVAFVCGVGHVAAMNNGLLSEEEEPSAHYLAAGDGPAASPYTEGVKRVLLIRVDFSDLAGEPFSEAAGRTLLTNLNNYFTETSYGKTTVPAPSLGSDVTPLFRMPQTAVHYGSVDRGYDALRADARAAADAAGYLRGNYEFDVTCIGPVPGFNWGGLGYVGAPGSWIRNTSSTGTTAHELGHNLGLNHANFWDTGGQSIFGPNGNDPDGVEYGDNYDTMGSGGSSRPYNARYRAYLNWIVPGEVVTAATNGIYRLGAYDRTNSTGTRAIRILRSGSGGTNSFWLEFRQRAAGNYPFWLTNGVGLRWAGSGSQKSILLDTTPGSSAGSSSKDDAPIWMGRTFSDPGFGIHITPLRKLGTTPESVEVMINRGTFLTNLPPVVTFTASLSNAAVGAAITFNATAVDPNGDALAYSWDFSDGTGSTVSSASATHAWTAAGEYVVRCIVSDMKGGVASFWRIVRIGSPSTFRISGRVINDLGEPMQNARVYVSGTRMAYTGSDGAYNIVALPAGSYTVRASLDQWTFSGVGFGNPVAVGPNAGNVDFIGVPAGGISTEILVAQGSEWKYLDDGSNQGTNWIGLDFNDVTWNAGPAQLGYGDNDETTVVRSNGTSGRIITTYFRHLFQVTNVFDLTAITLALLRDDGGVVYLNGREVFRSNMPLGPVNHLTRASDTADDESAFYEKTLDAADFVDGTNILAVEIHQESPTSSDISFDLSISALNIGNLPRAIAIGSPLNNSFVVGPTNVFVNVNASAGRGATIARVNVFANGNSLGEATERPYSIVWSNPPVAIHTLTAIATDSAGLTLTSAPVAFSVSGVVAARRAPWKYLDNGSDQGTNFARLDYNDSTWLEGPAPLGYGETYIRTPVAFGTNLSAKHITTYFRRSLSLDNADSLTNVVFRLMRDDGAVVWLNGVEIFRSNMPTGAIDYLTRAAAGVDLAADESRYYEFPVEHGRLVNGPNLLAVEVHQSAPTSSDLAFDLEILASSLPAPDLPTLSVELLADEIRLIWPATYTGWRLNYCSNFTEAWTPSSHSVTISNNQNVVTIPAPDAARFYRLSKP